MMRIVDRVQSHLDHKFAEGNLSAYMDDRLTERERGRLERHLQACATCRDALATLRQTVNLVRRAPRLPVPRSFALPRSVQSEQARFRRWDGAFVALRNATLVASALFVLLISGDAVFSVAMSRIPVGAPRAARQLSDDGAPTAVAAYSEPALEPGSSEAAAGTEPLAAAPPAAAPEAPGAERDEPQAEMVPAPPGAPAAPEQPAPTLPAEEAHVPSAAQAPEEGVRGEVPEADGSPAPSTAWGRGGIGGGGDAPPAAFGGPALGGAGDRGAEPTMTPSTAEPTVDAALAPEPEVRGPAPTAEPAEPAEVMGAAGEMTAAPSATQEPLALARPPERETAEGATEADASAHEALALEPRPLWPIWQTVRVAAGLLLGLILMLLGGLVWVGYQRRSI